MKKVSVVVSCYNEAAGLEDFCRQTGQALEDSGWDWELLFVNDGSTDDTLPLLRRLAEGERRMRIVSLSRNFGHEAAMTAGVDYARGDAVICMDADLQHPPACLPEMLERLEQGYDVVTMVRTDNPDTGIAHRLADRCFYRLLNALSPVRLQENASDFFGLSRRAAQVLRREYRERVRYLRGYVQSMGFRCCTLTFRAGQRAAGRSHYSLARLIHFSITTLCGFSDVPLKLGIYAGFAAGGMGAILMVYSIVMRICFDQPSGYTTIVVALCFLFALTLTVIGIIGEYISVLMQEIKGRPIYLVEELVNLQEERE